MHGAYRPHDRVQTIIEGESATKQQFADEVDINRIMDRYERDGIIAHVNRYEGQYGDFGDAPSYHAAMNTVVEAQEMFESLPARIRDRFGNSPAVFLEFVQDPANQEELVDLGLATRRGPEGQPTAGPSGPDNQPEEPSAPLDTAPSETEPTAP